MHPREAVSPSLSRAGLAGGRATRRCSALWIEDWLIAPRLRLRQGKGKARRRKRQQPGMRAYATAIRRGDLSLGVIVRPFCAHPDADAFAALHRLVLMRACVLSGSCNMVCPCSAQS